jgi:hypothetical protein
MESTFSLGTRMSRMRNVAAVALLLVSAVSAQTKGAGKEQVVWAPPELDCANQQSLRATVTKPIVESFHVGKVRILLEDTELSDVAKLLRAATGRRGDAGDYVEWLCFQGTDSGGRFAMWLESDEIAGGVTDGIAVSRLTIGARVDRRCRVLHPNETVVTNPKPIGLGMKRKDVIQLLGNPSATDGNTMVFEHEHEVRIKNEPYTVNNTVSLLFHNGVVTGIQVWKRTVN